MQHYTPMAFSSSQSKKIGSLPSHHLSAGVGRMSLETCSLEIKGSFTKDQTYLENREEGSKGTTNH
jgi:hypothetical protein